METTNYKRKVRQMPEQTKQRISQALKGRQLSDEHKAHIADGQRAAWAKIPYSIGVENNSKDKYHKNENEGIV